MLKFRDLKEHRQDGDHLSTDAAIGEESLSEKELEGFTGSSPEPAQHPTDLTEALERSERLYQEAFGYLEDTFTRVKTNKPISLDEGSRVVRGIVDTHVDNSIFSMALHGKNGSDFLVSHSANVAIYSIKMGAGLGFNREKQVQLGLAGLLHEVGKCLVPEEVLYKQGKLSDEEFSMIRDAPNQGYEILKALGPEHAYLAECCLQVYERIDGSGYPKGLKGEELHEYAQIIGLVDVYEALTHSRPQRAKFLHFAAVKEIVKSGKSAFRRDHLKALLKIFSIFPLDSCVKLNSNAIGRVMETYQDQPMRPKLQIITDSQGGQILTEQIVNLPEHPLLYIVDSVPEQELEEARG